eukprot:5783494-Prymnesium_polylepis.3
MSTMGNDDNAARVGKAKANAVRMTIRATSEANVTKYAQRNACTLYSRSARASPKRSVSQCGRSAGSTAGAASLPAGSRRKATRRHRSTR